MRSTFVAPGANALTRIPSGASSTASWIVSALIPPLLAAYGVMFRIPRAATTVETLTIEPPPELRISRAASTEQKNVPLRFVSMTRSHVSSLGSSTFVHPDDARAVDEHVEPRRAARTSLGRPATSETSQREREAAALGRQLRVHPGRLLEVVHVDERALGGEAEREHAADPARGARDERDLPSSRPLTESPRRATPTRRCSRTSRARRA